MNQDQLDQMAKQEKQAVKELGDRIGYGRVMQLAQECWKEAEIENGQSGGSAFVYGPCLSMTVPCGCGCSCSYCNGSGRLTPLVKAFKDSNHSR